MEWLIYNNSGSRFCLQTRTGVEKILSPANLTFLARSWMLRKSSTWGYRVGRDMYTVKSVWRQKVCDEPTFGNSVWVFWDPNNKATGKGSLGINGNNLLWEVFVLSTYHSFLNQTTRVRTCMEGKLIKLIVYSTIAVPILCNEWRTCPCTKKREVIKRKFYTRTHPLPPGQ